MATAQVFEPGTGWTTLSSSNMPASGVTSGTYGNATNVGQFTVGADGRITSAVNVTITGGGGGTTEYDYVAITSNVTVSSSTESSPNDVIVGNSVSYNGSTRVKIEGWLYDVAPSGGGNTYVVVNLWDGSTNLGRIGLVNDVQGTLKMETFLTPSNAAHTYKLRAWNIGGSGTIGVQATTPTFAINPGGFLRITGA